MKLKKLTIHNFRSIIDAEIRIEDYTLLVGANNAGKSTVLNALRAFYEEGLKWTKEDMPKKGAADDCSWVELMFELPDDEWATLADGYKPADGKKALTVRRFFKSDEKGRVQASQSNIFAVTDGVIDKELFYGAKNIGSAKLGELVYIPALTKPEDQTKLSGPSPLREAINFLLKKVVTNSDPYKQLTEAMDKLNEEAKKKEGFFAGIAAPINEAIAGWDVSIDLSVGSISVEDISKNLIQLAFVDTALGGPGLDLSRYGHGFQRTIIYELIKMAPTFKEERKANKKEFNPDFSLILFEEPEAFLHPSQQESMAYHLKRLTSETTQQVIITTHSPIFAGKATRDIQQIVRVARRAGLSSIYQPKPSEIEDLFHRGRGLLKVLEAYVADETVADEAKKDARRFIGNPPADDIAAQEEFFRFQLWLDGERSSAFFADQVLLVEGPTEKALFNYLLAIDWHDLATKRICVIDTLGKFNLHRFMALFEAFGIPHGVMLDDDLDNEHHRAVNELVRSRKNAHTVAEPVLLPDCCEAVLGLPKGKKGRDDKKPIEVLKALTDKTIKAEKLEGLRGYFEKALAL